MKRWLHKKSGRSYKIIKERAIAAISDELRDGQSVVVYRNELGQVFVRPTKEFYQRFMPIEEDPVAWQYQLAQAITNDGIPKNWTWCLSAEKPDVPEGMIRNLKPLYSR